MSSQPNRSHHSAPDRSRAAALLGVILWLAVAGEAFLLASWLAS